VGLGIPEYEAKRAREVLEHTGAEDVSSSGEAKADFATGDKPLPRRPVVVETPVETVRTTPLPPEDVDRPVIDETRRTRTAGDRIVEP
jgi:hypothetical protein